MANRTGEETAFKVRESSVYQYISIQIDIQIRYKRTDTFDIHKGLKRKQ